MSQHIRTYNQQHHMTGCHHEISLRRSDSFLYLEALVAHDPTELWRDETGLVHGPHLKQIFERLRDKRYNAGGRMEPFSCEAFIRHGATVERFGLGGKRNISLCTDIESVTLYFRGHHHLDSFLSDLESCLAWAA